jgi:hypothetical protein
VVLSGSVMFVTEISVALALNAKKLNKKADKNNLRPNLINI